MRPDRVADLCQEVFLRLYLAGPRYRETGGFSTWLYEIALNAARDAGRQSGDADQQQTQDLLDAATASRPVASPGDDNVGNHRTLRFRFANFPISVDSKGVIMHCQRFLLGLAFGLLAPGILLAQPIQPPAPVFQPPKIAPMGATQVKQMYEDIEIMQPLAAARPATLAPHQLHQLPPYAFCQPRNPWFGPPGGGLFSGW